MKLRLHPLFLIMIIVFIFLGKFSFISLYLSVVLLHELGHYIVAYKLGYTLGKLYLLPYGVCLSYSSECFTPQDEIKIALAGPLVNLFICILCLASWWIFPITYGITYQICFSSFITFLFNLLPVYPLDGGRILKGIASQKLTTKQIIRVLKCTNIFFSSVFIIIFIISIFYKLNLNYLIISILLISGIFEFKFESRYELNKIKNSKRLLTKGVDVVFKAYSSNVYLYQIFAKLNRFKRTKIIIKFKDGKEKIFDEEQIEKYISLYGAKITFEEIFNKKLFWC